MTDARITREVLEILRNADPNARVTRENLEALRNAIAKARVTRQSLGALYNTNPKARVTRQAIEVIYKIKTFEMSAGNIPSGALYLDSAYEQDDSILNNPILMNTFPYDKETGVPASDAKGSHPLHLTIVDIVGTDGLAAGQTIIDIVVGYLATYSSPAGSISSSVETTDDLIEVRINESISISDEIHMGIEEQVFNGSSFSANWDTDSSYTAIASDGGATIDEHRFILFRETAFESLQNIRLEIYAETDNVSPDVLSTIYSFTIEDLTKPELLSVATRGLKNLRVIFNEAMEQGTDIAGDSIRIKDISGGVEVVPSEGVTPTRIITSREIFESGDVGLYLGIAGAENALNNDVFQISAFISETIVEIGSADVIAETLPISAVVTVSPYRVDGIPDDALVNPYFNPVVTDAEAITTSEIELTLHTEITPNRDYDFYATSVEDLNDNTLDPVSIEFTTEPLNIPRERDNEDFTIPEMIPWGNRRPEEDATRDLERFLNCLDEVFQLLLYDIDRFPDILDVDLISESNLDALLFHLGAPFSFSGSLSENEKRRLAAILVDAYKRKGVEVGMEAMIAYVLGINVDIRPYYDPDSYWALGLSALGDDAILGPGSEFLKYSFEVITAGNLTETQRRRLTEMIEWMKPAHTHFVRLLEPGYQIVINDILFVTDQVSINLSDEVILSDSLIVADQIALALSYQRAISDSLSVSDQIAIDSSFNKLLSDALVVSDQISIALSYQKELSDSLVTSDQISAALVYQRALSDSLTVSDQVNTALSYQRVLSDSLAVSDQVDVDKTT